VINLLFKNNFDSVLNILPYELRNILFDLSDEVEEIRLRVNKKVSYTSNGVSKPLDCITTSHDLEKVIEMQFKFIHSLVVANIVGCDLKKKHI